MLFENSSDCVPGRPVAKKCFASEIMQRWFNIFCFLVSLPPIFGGANYCPWPLILGKRIPRPGLEEVEIVWDKLEHVPSHECTWWLLVLDYRQGHRTSVHDQQVLQVLHNNVVFNQIVKNRQHQPWQPLFLIKVFQLSDAQHICKASGSKRLEIRVCEIGKRCRLVPSAPGNNARRGNVVGA